MAREFWKSGNMLYPLPAVMVSCGREGEKPNIITIAWAGTVCSSPAMVSISVRQSRYSYDIIRETGEFVINLVTEELVRAADYCGVRSGRDVDKFKTMGLTPVPSRTVSAVSIGESPVSLECKVQQVIPLGSHDMFIAEVTAVSVDDRYMDETGKFCLNDSRLAVYSHGQYYGLGENLGRFGYSVKRPEKKAEQTAGQVKPADRKADKKSNNRSNNRSNSKTNKKADKYTPAKQRRNEV